MTRTAKVKAKAKAKGGARAPQIAIATRGGPFQDVTPAVLKRRAGKMLARLGLRDVELSIALVDDATIKELNRSYRRKDKPTDVLSFPMLEPLTGKPPRARKTQAARKGEATEAREESVVRFESATGVLGDVILSVETARRQAAANGRPLLAELTMLLAHGLLHLVGYDHRTDAEERAMNEATAALERAAAARLSRPL